MQGVQRQALPLWLAPFLLPRVSQTSAGQGNPKVWIVSSQNQVILRLDVFLKGLLDFICFFCWCFSPEVEERMAGDAGKALVKAVGASQKAGAVAIEVNSKNNICCCYA